MSTIMSEIQMQMNALPTWVNVWINWMMFIFFCSVFFIRKHRMARFALGALLLTMPIALVVFHFSKSVHLFGIAHLIVWLPLLIYIMRTHLRSSGFALKSVYDFWLILLILTISISLPFDVRDIILVCMGRK